MPVYLHHHACYACLHSYLLTYLATWLSTYIKHKTLPLLSVTCIYHKVIQQDQDFSFCQYIWIGSGSHLTSAQWELSTFSLELKWPGHKADYLPVSSAKVKNAWSPPLLLYALML